MSLPETEHGSKDLEAFADKLIKNYDSKVSKLLDEKLDKRKGEGGGSVRIEPSRQLLDDLTHKRNSKRKVGKPIYH